MKVIRSNVIVTNRVSPAVVFGIQPTASRISFLYWVTADDLQQMRNAIARGTMPPDFEAKLRKLAGGNLIHASVEQNCRLFIALLTAAHDGAFVEADESERERLLRVLAYVRKDNDAMPDYKPEGFVDDQQEVRAVTMELGALLRAFKTWRLRHQVPSLWATAA
jgi:hypothetical protein